MLAAIEPAAVDLAWEGVAVRKAREPPTAIAAAPPLFPRIDAPPAPDA